VDPEKETTPAPEEAKQEEAKEEAKKEEAKKEEPVKEEKAPEDEPPPEKEIQDEPEGELEDDGEEPWVDPWAGEHEWDDDDDYYGEDDEYGGLDFKARRAHRLAKRRKRHAFLRYKEFSESGSPETAEKFLAARMAKDM